MKEKKEYEWNEGLLAIREAIEKELLEFSSDSAFKIGGQPLLVAVAGGSCSGKTTLAQELARCFVGEANVISLDNYYKDIRDSSLPRDEKGWPIFDCPEAYRPDELLSTIDTLSADRDAWLPKYDLATNHFIDPWGEELSPRRIIIVEGLYAIQFLMAYKKQLKVYVEVDYQLALDRRLRRDVEKYQMEVSKIERRFKEEVWPGHLFHIIPQIEQADIIINQP